MAATPLWPKNRAPYAAATSVFVQTITVVVVGSAGLRNAPETFPRRRRQKLHAQCYVISTRRTCRNGFAVVSLFSFVFPFFIFVRRHVPTNQRNVLGNDRARPRRLGRRDRSSHVSTKKGFDYCLPCFGRSETRRDDLVSFRRACVVVRPYLLPPSRTRHFPRLGRPVVRLGHFTRTSCRFDNTVPLGTVRVSYDPCYKKKYTSAELVRLDSF